jgi:hypothetical protein
MDELFNGIPGGGKELPDGADQTNLSNSPTDKFFADSYAGNSSWSASDKNSEPDAVHFGETDNAEETECSAAADSPQSYMLELADVISQGQLMEEGRLSSRAVSLIRSAIEACWVGPEDNIFRQGSVAWAQDQLNAIRPSGTPEFKFRYWPATTTLPLGGDPIYRPAGLEISIWSGSGWSPRNWSQIDR